MDVAHAILFAKTIDISRVTADYSSAKFESYSLWSLLAYVQLFEQSCSTSRFHDQFLDSRVQFFWLGVCKISTKGVQMHPCTSQQKLDTKT